MARVRLDKPPRELVDAIVASLATGAGWEFDDCFYVHPATGVEIWFPDDSSCVHIETRTHRYGSCYTPCGWLVPWRRRIVSAAMSAKAKQPCPDVLRETIAGLYAA